MKNVFYGILIFIGVIAVGIGLSYAFGWINVHQTKTIGKEKVNAKREVYETSQPYVEAKRQEAVKNYAEWVKAETPEDREVIENIVRLSFSNFDETLLQDEQLRIWIRQCKY